MATDKRIIRTQRAIRQAFELLIAQHPLSEITVKRLTDTAGINRKTFYLHYDSIDNLLDAYVTEISNHLVAILKERPFDDVIQEQNGYFLTT
jgi:Transcriptional regulator